jgi:DNA-binding CsgD family transcriptional regulator
MPPAGRGDAVAIRGEAGIGKTAILEHAVESAAGLRILRARGIESEVELAYSALLDLLRPVLNSLDALAEPQAAAVRAALLLSVSERPPDPLAVYVGTLGLLAAAAERSPLLVVVDDLQWVDAPSREAILFAARRLPDDPVATLVAVRGAAVSTEGLDELRLEPLDDGAAREVMAESALAPAVATRVLAAAAGNPLALVELPRALTPDQRDGAAPIPDPMPGGEAPARLFGHRLSALDDRTRLALVVIAASTTEDMRGATRAMDLLGIDAQLALAGLEEAGLVSVSGGRVQFRHPLVRSAAYAGASADERRRCHRALADSPDVRQLADARAWHRALAAVEPDEAVAAELERTALRAPGRGSRAAARALEYAARLTPEPARRAARLVAAAEAAQAAGDVRVAAAMAAQALEPGGDVVVQARADRVLGSIEAQRDPRRAAALLSRAASAVETTDPELAALMLLDALDPLLHHGELAELQRLARRAWELPWSRGGGTEVALALRYGDALAEAGDVALAGEMWSHATRGADALEPGIRLLAAEALFSVGANERARSVLVQAIEELRRDGRTAETLIGVGGLALVDARLGHLAAAQATAAEELELARALDSPLEQAHASGLSAWIAAIRGSEADCRTYADEARRLAGGNRHLAAMGDHAEGLLELGYGRGAHAVEPLLRASHGRVRSDSVAPRPIVASLIEALARTERRNEAETWLVQFERSATASGRGAALAEAARCRGLLADDERFDAEFGEAIRHHEHEPIPFESARTRLCYGERLRRSKRKRQAGEQLRASLAAFERMGAWSWADRAAKELKATGDVPRLQLAAPGGRELTAQEMNVARLVVEGLTNRELAARLFLSQKTIETHLAHVFKKVGVRSRTELAVRLAATGSGFFPIEPARLAP